MHLKNFRMYALAGIAVAAVSAGSPAFADYIFQTATAGTNGAAGVYSAYGDGTDAGSNFIGTTFALSAATSGLQVGANIDGYGVGSAFAEIVSVSSLASLPAVATTGSSALVNYLQSNSLGTAVFKAPSVGGDASAFIFFNSSLAAGDYALIFGSGLFGTTGGSAFGAPLPGQINFTDNSSNGNTTIGSPNIFSSLGGDNFQNYGYDTGIRIFAAPVPLPATLPLMVSGLAGFVWRRRRAIAARNA